MNPSTQQQIALVESSYNDGDNYLTWCPVAVFPDFDQAFAWCKANQNTHVGESLRTTRVILLEEPHLVAGNKPEDDPIFTNFVDIKGISHLIDWDANDLICSVKIKLVDRAPLNCNKILRIRMCPLGPLKEAKSRYTAPDTTPHLIG